VFLSDRCGGGLAGIPRAMAGIGRNIGVRKS